MIEARVQRERPCRTLFIRNIAVSLPCLARRLLEDERSETISAQYDASSQEMRRQFDDFGEIKTFFDLVAKRGMVFVTFVRLSAQL